MGHVSHDQKKSKPRFGLSQQIVVGLIVGIIAGYAVNVWYGGDEAGRKAFLVWPVLVQHIFLNLIRMMVAPLVFASLVQGIAGHEDMKKVGRIGVKALVYFEVLSALAGAPAGSGSNCAVAR